MAAARLVLAALLLAVAASSAFAAAPAGRNGRMLLQSGVSCPAQIPACTARRCTTRIMDSQETFVCLRCQRGYVPVKGSDGKSVVQCVCPPGTFQNSTATPKACVPCTTGSFCPGGDPKARKPSDNIGGLPMSCNANNSTGLTTKSERSTRRADCIARAGYVLPATAGSPAQECTGSTYAPAFNRLRTCLPCQSGLAAPPDYTGARDDKLAVCQVPPGKFWELNVVRDCPKGLYREEYVRTDNKTSIACKSCPEGWTTAQIGTIALRLCNVLLPGYQVVNFTNNSTNNGTIDTNGTDWTPPETEFCPVGSYSDGTTAGCQPCPYSATTLKNGSISADDCVVPPGYFVRDSAANANGEMVQCYTTPANSEAEGYYRPGWKSYKEVLSTNPAKDGKDICTKCGEDIMSAAVDADERPGAAAGSLAPATSAGCYIKAGWGITFDPSDFTKFKAIKPCPANTYGVANTTFGLINAPCKACTKNLYSNDTSTKFTDCKNPGGFGYTSEGANQCPDGFWAAKDSMGPCEQCPPGKTTFYQPGNGTLQDNIDDCFPEAGSGVYDGSSDTPFNPSNPTNGSLPAKPCPIGFFSAGGAGAVCQECQDFKSSRAEGSATCDTCVAGFGKVTGSTDCEVCPDGTYNVGVTSDTCSSCPSTTFNDFVGDGYTSYGITFGRGVSNVDACVPRFAQVPKPVGDRMGLPDSMFTVNVTITAATANAGVKECVEECPANKCCIAEMEKAGTSVTCKHARLDIADAMYEPDTARMFYKVPPSQIAAASKDNTKDDLKAKTMGSGLYAVCDITNWMADTKAGLVGTSPNPTLVEAGRDAIEWNTPQCNSINSCKTACMANAACWGFVLTAHPTDGGPAFALRGGESWLGGRTFFVSPDGKIAPNEKIGGWATFSS